MTVHGVEVDGRPPAAIFPSRTLVGGLTAIGLVFLTLVLTYWYLEQGAAVRTRTSVALSRNVERMRYYDEALTTSARLNPFAVDRSYERRYLRLAPQLDGVIRDTLRLVHDRQAAKEVALTSDANRRLVAMELHSFSLVRAGEPRRASALLTSPAYNTQKRRYAHGFEQSLRRFAYVSAKISADAALYVSVMLGVSFALLLFGFLPISVYLVRSARRWTAERRSAEEDALAREVLAAQNEQLRELDRFKDDLVASVSHELRTPLTSINGYLELVLNGEMGPLTVDQEMSLGVVRHNADRLLRLIGDLLFMAEVDSALVTINKDAIDLSLLASDAVTTAIPAADTFGIELSYVEEAEAWVDGDAHRLTQVLDNLISNALKFTPRGGSVEVQVAALDQTIRLAVSDNGDGISHEDQKRLFERFFRTDSATKQAIQGTGLGLSIVNAIVTEHGGTIEIKSELGHGTTFTIVLPNAKIAVPAAA